MGKGYSIADMAINAEYIFNDMPKGLELTKKCIIYTGYSIVYFDGENSFEINQEISDEVSQLQNAYDNQIFQEFIGDMTGAAE